MNPALPARGGSFHFWYVLLGARREGGRMDHGDRNPFASRIRVGEMFRSARVARGFRIIEVARLAGLPQKAKSFRNIDRLEREGQGPTDLVRSLATFFAIDLGAVVEAWRLDEADRRRFRWEATGGRPYLVLRLLPGVYLQTAMPEGLDREEAINWARTVLQERWEGRLRGCVVLSPDEVAWLKEDGSCRITHDVLPPWMSLKGKPFIFAEG